MEFTFLQKRPAFPAAASSRSFDSPSPGCGQHIQAPARASRMLVEADAINRLPPIAGDRGDPIDPLSSYPDFPAADAEDERFVSPARFPITVGLPNPLCEDRLRQENIFAITVLS